VSLSEAMKNPVVKSTGANAGVLRV
jgi:hypothetical protein